MFRQKKGGFVDIISQRRVLLLSAKLSDTLKMSDNFWRRTVKLLKIKNIHFSGIVVALFGLLIIGADMMPRSVEVPALIIMAIQGLIILALVSSQVFLSQEQMRMKLIKLLPFRKR